MLLLAQSKAFCQNQGALQAFLSKMAIMESALKLKNDWKKLFAFFLNCPQSDAIRCLFDSFHLVVYPGGDFVEIW